MAEKVNDVLSQILNHIENKKNFLLSGGAGSGKTYSLVQVINEVRTKYPTKHIACITYTNAAAEEIKKRVGDNNLWVSTIHDFIWDHISHFQNELKICLVERLKDMSSDKVKSKDYIQIPDNLLGANFEEYFSDKDIKITYRDYTKVAKGIISHNEVLLLGYRMFHKYPKLRLILKSSYQFIFIDEYQDTDPRVIKIVLEELSKDTKHQTIIGFFGDSMQSIYDGSVGDLNSEIEAKLVSEVQKKYNRRNPQSVINLANKLRMDNLKQEIAMPSPEDHKNHGPNVDENGNIKNGTTLFLYARCKEEDFKSKVDNYLCNTLNWDLEDSNNFKRLNLTHRLNAKELGFQNLHSIFANNPILDILKKKCFDNITNELTIEDIVDKQIDDYHKLLEKRGGGKSNFAEYIEKYPKYWHIAKKFKLSELKTNHASQDELIDDSGFTSESKNRERSKLCPLINYLVKIEDLILLYKNKEFGTFLNKAVNVKVKGRHTLQLLDATMKGLIELDDNCSIETVIQKAEGIDEDSDGIALVRKGDELSQYKVRNRFIYECVLKVPYKEFRNLYDYLHNNSSLSTQHKTKGLEYSKVLVNLNSTSWNKYKFEQMLKEWNPDWKVAPSSDVINRSLKLFYVCCTRAMDELVVTLLNPSQQVLENAYSLFGKDSVINLDNNLA